MVYAIDHPEAPFQGLPAGATTGRRSAAMIKCEGADAAPHTGRVGAESGHMDVDEELALTGSPPLLLSESQDANASADDTDKAAERAVKRATFHSQLLRSPGSGGMAATGDVPPLSSPRM